MWFWSGIWLIDGSFQSFIWIWNLCIGELHNWKTISPQREKSTLWRGKLTLAQFNNICHADIMQCERMFYSCQGRFKFNSDKMDRLKELYHPPIPYLPLPSHLCMSIWLQISRICNCWERDDWGVTLWF